MASGPRVTLYSRPGCHLCDDAREVVERVAAEAGVEWQERSIAGDEDLERRYGELIPVVLVDGRQHAYWSVDPERLRADLDAGGGGSSWLRRWRRTP